jgi:hypothetical protein
MAHFCTECGGELNDAVKFCAGCGAKTDITPARQEQTPLLQPAPVQPIQQQYIQPPVGQQPQRPAPPSTPQGNWNMAKPPGTLFYLGNIFIMSLPFAGLVLSIMFSLKKVPSNKRSLARAMILFSVISIIISVAMGIMLFIYTQVVDDLNFRILGIKIF